MFNDNSRYKDLPVKSHLTETGEEVRYVARRFLPDPSTLAAMDTVRVTEDTRLDHLAHRRLGEATFFWRIADANRTLHPDELLKPLGRQITIPGPTGIPPQPGEN